MLHELIEYARGAGVEGEAGFTTKNVRWLIIFDPTGHFLSVTPLGENDKRSAGREFAKAPHLQFSGDTPMRQFLVDTAKFVLLFAEIPPGEDAQPTDSKAWEKLNNKRQYFLRLLREAASADPFLGCVADSLEDNHTREKICSELAKQSPKAKPTDNVTFAEMKSDGLRIVLEGDSWRKWWRNHYPSLFSKPDKKATSIGLMRCFVSGELVAPARTHPKIKRLEKVGGNSETTLIGFNNDSFCSYGLSQSSNAAISEEIAQHYAAALNDLIARRGHHFVGSKIVYWYTGKVCEDKGDDILREIFDPMLHGIVEQRDTEGEDSVSMERLEYDSVKRARELLEAIQSGRRPELRDARYCALTLSGNVGRVVVRDWMDGRFEELLHNVLAWFNDLSIVSRDGSHIIQAHKFGAVLAAPVRELSEIAAPTVTALWRCALQGPERMIPYEVMARTLGRIKIDISKNEAARHARFGLLKAFCNRNKEMPIMTEECNEEMDHPAYLCGRMLAILANIQRVALGDVGAGVVQRYYASASATPGLVLGRLIRLAQTGHLPKIHGGLRRWFDQQLTDVWSRLNKRPPTTLTLEEQTLFAMGYYHQQAKRSPKPEERDAEEPKSAE